MGVLAVVATLAIPPLDASRVRESVDLIEVNTVWDECGRIVLSQLIFYDFDRVAGRYQVVDWRLVSQTGTPRVDHRRRLFVVVWWDCKNGGVRREVTSTLRRITHTLYDVEVAERDVLPQDHRRKLRRCPTR